jgi:hypothetical protein
MKALEIVSGVAADPQRRSWVWQLYGDVKSAASVTGLPGPLKMSPTAQVAARFWRPAIVEAVPYCLVREVPALSS